MIKKVNKSQTLLIRNKVVKKMGERDWGKVSSVTGLLQSNKSQVGIPSVHVQSMEARDRLGPAAN